jgi:hypothetical protein
MTTTTTGTGSIAVLQLTDEELAALATTAGIVVFPVLSALDAGQQSLAVRTAYRSLVARGLVEAPSAEEERDAFAAAAAEGRAHAEVPVRMPESVSHVLALRAGADRVVAVSLTTAAGQEFRYAHVVEDVVLEELVTGSGLHTFCLSRRDDLPATLERWALHPEAADGSGDPVAAGPAGDPTPPRALLETAGAALLRADLVLRRGDDPAPQLIGLLSGPHGTWMSRTRFGSGDDAALRPLTVDAVRSGLREALDGLA